MLNRIRSWYDTHQHKDASDFDGPFAVGKIVAKFGKERFGVIALRSAEAQPCEDCGKECLLLALGLIGAGDEWRPMVVMHESRLPIMLSVLAEVQDFLMSFERGEPVKEVA